MFDIVPPNRPCTFCNGEGYFVRKMEEIWLQGVRIIPYTNDVYVLCIYCMGTGDDDRKVLESFKYLDLYEKNSDTDPEEKSRALWNMRQIEKSYNEGTLRKSFKAKPSRFECYDWDFDFEKMKKYPDSIILKAKEKSEK
jgi:hypothetical protein